MATPAATRTSTSATRCSWSATTWPKRRRFSGSGGSTGWGGPARRGGPAPPKLIVVDPRETATAKRADLHLAIRGGTNLPLLLAIQHELIATKQIDRTFVDDHTVGFDELETAVSDWTPERAAEICGIDAQDIYQAASMLGGAERLVSSVLQGVYQSHQATASAIQVNNVNL